VNDIYRTARSWLNEGHRVAVATVTKTWGSAPRGQGAHLFIRDDGLFEGSVSGGCVEGDVVTEALSALDTEVPKRLSYGVADARAWEVGLACGGQIEILVQPVGAHGFAREYLDRIISSRDAGKMLTLYTGTDGVTSEQAAEGAFARSYSPPLTLMIVGAVHISQALIPIARTLGYDVRAVDPRGNFAKGERFAGIDIDDRWPDEALAEWRPGAASAVVTLTHDPKLDDPALIAALRSDAFYIAALGSRRTHAARVERLLAEGFSESDIARIKGPAGLDIGAANPPEIALSVAAEMVATWRSRH
jgi:xanthine dehydrogenase accessory factor|tara:strand:- start:25221 stop:26132 length:912 start_codon:yes stop_codon:yes gene_type:complete